MSEAKKTTKNKKTTVKNFTPQQVDFAMRYYMPTSKTYGNALQSALAAGYSRKYSENITIKDLGWLESIVGEIVGRKTDKRNLVEKAKRVLDKSLDSADDKLAQDTAKFVAKSTPEFSEKQDITTAGEKITVALTEFLDGDTKEKV